MQIFHHRRRLGVAAVASVAALALAACGSSSSASTSSDGAASSVDTSTAKATISKLEQPITTWPGITKLNNPVDLKGKQVMIVPLIEQAPILLGMATGAKEALEHMGAKVTICDGKAAPTTVDSCLKQAQAQKFAAVITNFVSFPMDPNGFTTLADSGTKVLIAGDSKVAGKTYPKNVEFYDSSSYLKQVSEYEADAAVARQGSNANVIWLSQTDSANTIAQGDAGEARFKKDCPTCGFDRIKYATQDMDKIPSLISAALVSHPKTNEIVVAVDTISPQVLQGVQSAGFAGKVKLIGNGSDVGGLQMVKSGQQTDDLGASASYDGFAMANALEQFLAGETVTPQATITRDFTSNNIGDLKISPAEYDTPDWFGSDSFKNDFYQAWGAQ